MSDGTPPMSIDDLLPNDVLLVTSGVFVGNIGRFVDRMGARAIGIRLPQGGVLRVPISHVRLADNSERENFEQQLRRTRNSA
jgi:hypothetical protein